MVVSCKKADTIIPTSAITVFEAYPTVQWVAVGHSLGFSGFKLSDSAPDGVKIKNVTYYFGGDKITKTSTSPYSLNYDIQDQEVEVCYAYSLSAKVHVEGAGEYLDTDIWFKNLKSVMITQRSFDKMPEIEWDEDIRVLDGDEKYAGTVVTTSGEYLSGVVKILDYPWECTPKVTISLDDEEIYVDETEPYEFDILVDGYDAATTHEFSYSVYFPYDDRGFSYSTTYQLIVE